MRKLQGGVRRKMTVDPVTVMTTISVGLKLIDQFGDLAKRFMDQQPQPPAQRVEQAGNSCTEKSGRRAEFERVGRSTLSRTRETGVG